jgi:hypothetical protein
MSPLVLDGLGHLGYLMLFSGTAAIARGHAWGWAGRVAGSATWAVLGYHMGYTSILLWSLVFLNVDLYGWRRNR